MLHVIKSIKERIALYVLLFTLCFTGLSVFVQFYIDYSQQQAQIQSQLLAKMRSSLVPLSEALQDRESREIDALLSNIRSFDFVDCVELFDKDGNSVAFKGDEEHSDLTFSFSLYHDERETGLVSIGIDKMAIRQSLYDHVLLVMALNIIKIVILVSALLWLVTRIVTNPLITLYDRASRINKKGSLTKVVFPSALLERGDEISHVAQAVTKLQQQARQALAEQKKVEHQLRVHQHQLECTIAERTEAISKQAELNSILAELTLSGINSKNATLSDSISSAIASLAILMDIDHVAVLECQDNTLTLAQVWPEVERREGEISVQRDQVMFLERHLISKSPLIVDDIDTLREFYEDYRYLRVQLLQDPNVRSFAAFPLSDGSESFGLLTVARRNNRLPWSKERLDILNRFATALSELFIHQKHLKTLSEMQEELLMLNAQLQVSAETDELTGLSNRRPFRRHLKAALAAQEQGEDVALFMLDIDYYKKFNDIYGHVQGDLALKYVAGALLDAFESHGHHVARIGGEEFAAIAVGIDQDEVVHMAQAAIDEVGALQIPHKASETGFISISIGAHLITSTSEPISRRQWQECADEALYAAKTQGRNRAVVSSR
uniref:diguanylate cyclase domain-containing protein n=1 Tax=Thaumasiovibrio occultus TaxID=1891184 RepID=UPI00131B86B7|nr:diguanylate cyclase [Thaumasiovibrio occultus]